MFETGKKYQRTVITKKKHVDIAYYACVLVGEFNTLFKTYSIDGKSFNEVLIPNGNFTRFELFSDEKHRVDYLSKSIDKLETNLRDTQLKKSNLINEEIKLINQIKLLKTKIDGKDRTLLTLEKARNMYFEYNLDELD
jgi:hypothetical protein